MVSAPDTRGSLGILCFERGHHGMADVGQGEFFQVKLGGFLQIGDRLLDGWTLAHGTDLGALSNIEAAFSVQDCGERAYGHTALFYPRPD